jgi:hypothetical protein
MEKDNINQRKSVVTLLISDKVGIGTRKITHMEQNYVMIKGILEILNVYTPNNRAEKCEAKILVGDIPLNN